MNSHNGQLSLRAAMPQLSVQDGDEGFEITDVEMDMQENRIADYLWGGEKTLKIGAITSQTFAMNDFSIYAKVTDDNPVIHQEMIFEFPFIRYDDLEITDGKFDFAFRTIDKRNFASYYETVFNSVLGGAVNPERMLKSDSPKLVTRFLNGAPEYLIREFSFTLPAGRLTSSMGVHFDGAGEINLTDLNGLLQRITSEGQIALLRSLALEMAKSSPCR